MYIQDHIIISDKCHYNTMLYYNVVLGNINNENQTNTFISVDALSSSCNHSTCRKFLPLSNLYGMFHISISSVNIVGESAMSKYPGLISKLLSVSLQT